MIHWNLMENEQIQLELSRLSDAFNKLIRRVDGLQKSVDLLYQDREILEDMQGSIKSLQEVLLYSRQHVDNAVKDVKAEVIEQGLKVEEKVQSVKETVQDNITGLVQNIEKKKNVIVVKEGLFKKFKGFLFRR